MIYVKNTIVRGSKKYYNDEENIAHAANLIVHQLQISHPDVVFKLLQHFVCINTCLGQGKVNPSNISRLFVCHGRYVQKRIPPAPSSNFFPISSQHLHLGSSSYTYHSPYHNIFCSSLQQYLQLNRKFKTHGKSDGFATYFNRQINKAINDRLAH